MSKQLQINGKDNDVPLPGSVCENQKGDKHNERIEANQE